MDKNLFFSVNDHLLSHCYYDITSIEKIKLCLIATFNNWGKAQYMLKLLDMTARKYLGKYTKQKSSIM